MEDSISEHASEGGKARAKSLTPEERSAIARKAVETRWERAGKTPMPRATHDGPLKIGDVEFDCAVLEDGTRVISEAKFMQAMGMYRSGALSNQRKDSIGSARIPLFMAHKNLIPFATKHLGGVHMEPVKFITKSGSIAHGGIKAELIPKICEMWMDARKAGVLGHRQELIAEKSEVLIRGFAHVGIIALVDEATGYQADRNRDALAKILEAFIAKELRPWVRTFESDFYQELFRLQKLEFKGTLKAPRYIGKITNDLVYDRLAPGVREELNRINPKNEKGQRKHKNFQWLTEHVGYQKLKQHLKAVTVLMKVFDDWETFHKNLDRVLPVQRELPLFDPPKNDLSITDQGDRS